MTNINLNIVGTADFRQIQASIKGLQSSLQMLQSQYATMTGATLAPVIKKQVDSFNELIEASGRFRVHTVESASAVERLGERLRRHKTDANDLKMAYRGVNKENNLFMDYGKRMAAIHQAQALRVGNLTHVYEELDGQMGKTNKTMMAQAFAIQAQNEALKQQAIRVINTGKNLQWTGRQLMMGISMPLVVFGAQTAKIFNEIDKNLTRLAKVYGVGLAQPTEAALEKIRRDVLELSRELGSNLGVAADEVTDIAAQFAAAGLQGNQLISATRQASRIVILGEADKQEAINATISLQTAYKLNTEELTEAVNFFNAAQAATSTSMGDLINAIPRVGPIIKGLGGTYKDMVAILTALKEGGVPAGEAANAIKNSLGRIINPTATAQARLKAFGIDIKDIVSRNAGNLVGTLTELQTGLKNLDDLSRQRAISELFGKYQFARMAAFIENFNTAGSQSAKITEMMGISAVELANIADEQTKKIQQSASGRFKIAVETMKNSLLPFGELALNIFADLAGMVTSLSETLKSLPEPVKAFLKVISGLAVFVGPMVMLTGLFLNFVGSIGQFVLRGKQFSGALRSLFTGGGIEGFKTIWKGFQRTDEIAERAAQAVDLLAGTIKTEIPSAADIFAAEMKKMERAIAEFARISELTSTSTVRNVGEISSSVSASILAQSRASGGIGGGSPISGIRTNPDAYTGATWSGGAKYPQGYLISHNVAKSRYMDNPIMQELFGKYPEVFGDLATASTRDATLTWLMGGSSLVPTNLQQLQATWGTERVPYYNPSSGMSREEALTGFLTGLTNAGGTKRVSAPDAARLVSSAGPQISKVFRTLEEEIRDVSQTQLILEKLIQKDASSVNAFMRQMAVKFNTEGFNQEEFNNALMAFIEYDEGSEMYLRKIVDSWMTLAAQQDMAANEFENLNVAMTAKIADLALQLRAGGNVEGINPRSKSAGRDLVGAINLAGQSMELIEVRMQNAATVARSMAGEANMALQEFATSQRWRIGGAGKFVSKDIWSFFQQAELIGAQLSDTVDIGTKQVIYDLSNGLNKIVGYVFDSASGKFVAMASKPFPAGILNLPQFQSTITRMAESLRGLAGASFNQFDREFQKQLTLGMDPETFMNEARVAGQQVTEMVELDGQRFIVNLTNGINKATAYVFDIATNSLVSMGTDAETMVRLMLMNNAPMLAQAQGVQDRLNATRRGDQLEYFGPLQGMSDADWDRYIENSINQKVEARRIRAEEMAVEQADAQAQRQEARQRRGMSMQRGLGAVGMLSSGAMMLTGTGNETVNKAMMGIGTGSMLASMLSASAGALATGGVFAFAALAPFIISAIGTLIDKSSQLNRAMEGAFKTSKTEAELLGVELVEIGMKTIPGITEEAKKFESEVSRLADAIKNLGADDPLAQFVASLKELERSSQLELIQQKYLTLRIQGVDDTEAREFVTAILKAAGLETSLGFETSRFMGANNELSQTEMIQRQFDSATKLINAQTDGISRLANVGRSLVPTATGATGINILMDAIKYGRSPLDAGERNAEEFYSIFARNGLGNFDPQNLEYVYGPQADAARKSIEALAESINVLIQTQGGSEFVDSVKELQAGIDSGRVSANAMQASVRELYTQYNLMDYFDAAKEKGFDLTQQMQLLQAVISGIVNIDNLDKYLNNPQLITSMLTKYDDASQAATLEDTLNTKLAEKAGRTEFTTISATAAAEAATKQVSAQQAVVDRLKEELDLRNEIIEAQERQLSFSNTMTSLQQKYNEALATGDMATALDIQRQMGIERVNYNKELEKDALEDKIKREEEKLAGLNKSVGEVAKQTTKTVEKLSDYSGDIMDIIYEAVKEGRQLTETEMDQITNNLKNKFDIPIIESKVIVQDLFNQFKNNPILSFAANSANELDKKLIPKQREAAILQAFILESSRGENMEKSSSEVYAIALQSVLGGKVTAIETTKGTRYKWSVGTPGGSGWNYDLNPDGTWTKGTTINKDNGAGTGGGGGGGGSFAAGGYVKDYEGGGAVRGPGTATSDSIHARLSNGEYVIRASSVQKYGKETFDALNTQKFANGGYVTGYRQGGMVDRDTARSQDKRIASMLSSILNDRDAARSADKQEAYGFSNYRAQAKDFEARFQQSMGTSYSNTPSGSFRRDTTQSQALKDKTWREYQKSIAIGQMVKSISEAGIGGIASGIYQMFKENPAKAIAELTGIASLYRLGGEKLGFEMFEDSVMGDIERDMDSLTLIAAPFYLGAGAKVATAGGKAGIRGAANFGKTFATGTVSSIWKNSITKGTLDLGRLAGRAGKSLASSARISDAASKSVVDGKDLAQIRFNKLAKINESEGRLPVSDTSTSALRELIKSEYMDTYRIFQRNNPGSRFNTFEEFFEAVENYSVGVMQRAVDASQIPEDIIKINKAYAEAVFGIDPESEIILYRNAITQDRGNQGYYSLDPDMAWNYGAHYIEPGGRRLSAKVKIDDMYGMLGWSELKDEFAIMLGEDVLSKPGVLKEHGPARTYPVAPWVSEESLGGNMRFRGFLPSYDFAVGDIPTSIINSNNYDEALAPFGSSREKLLQRMDEMFGPGSGNIITEKRGRFKPFVRDFGNGTSGIDIYRLYQSFTQDPRRADDIVRVLLALSKETGIDIVKPRARGEEPYIGSIKTLSAPIIESTLMDKLKLWAKVKRGLYHGSSSNWLTRGDFQPRDDRGWNFPGTYFTGSKFKASDYARQTHSENIAVYKLGGGLREILGLNVLNMSRKPKEEEINSLIASLYANVEPKNVDDVAPIAKRLRSAKSIDEAIAIFRNIYFPGDVEVPKRGFANDEVDRIFGIDKYHAVINYNKMSTWKKMLSDVMENKASPKATKDDINQVFFPWLAKTRLSVDNITAPGWQKDASTVPGLDGRIMQMLLGRSKGYSQSTELWNIASSSLSRESYIKIFETLRRERQVLSRGAARGEFDLARKFLGNYVEFLFGKKAGRSAREILKKLGQRANRGTDSGNAGTDGPTPLGYTGGYVNNGKIELPKFHQGGFVNYQYGKEVMAMLEGGEVVVPKEIVKNIQNGANNMSSVYNSNPNITINVAGTNATPQEIASAVSRAMQTRDNMNRSRVVIE